MIENFFSLINVIIFFYYLYEIIKKIFIFILIFKNKNKIIFFLNLFILIKYYPTLILYHMIIIGDFYFFIDILIFKLPYPKRKLTRFFELKKKYFLFIKYICIVKYLLNIYKLWWYYTKLIFIRTFFSIIHSFLPSWEWDILLFDEFLL